VVFETPEESEKAFNALKNRFFRERRIYLSFASENCYNVMFIS